MTMRIKIAVVGLGKIALDQHLPVLDQSPDFTLAAVVSQRGIGHGDVPVFRTAADLFKAMPEVSTVAFCTPPAGRFAAVAEALQAGKHVLMEKPPTPTLAELDALRSLADERGRVLFATWHCQHNPAVDQVRAALGREGVRSIAITWRESVWRWHPDQDWIWEPGGFGVFDPGINALSILTAILPHPVHVRSCRLEIPRNRQTPIAAEIVMGSLDGTPVTASFDWRERTAEAWDMDIETRTGTRYRISRGGGELRVDGTLLISGPKQEYQAIYARFAQLLESGQSSVDAAPLMLTADAFLLARREQVEAFEW
jgi:D-galactose 1-dehydrogenase